VVPGMHTPIGLWIDDELYVTPIEEHHRLPRFDGSRFAEEETILTFPGGGVAGVDSPRRRWTSSRGYLGAVQRLQPESRWAAAVVFLPPDGAARRSR
ncbi:hypothetical protein, partial [Candidatus Amarobacter glycogenicus]|uniref:hypothetical protein n=1 Tax=Candidatus Amarobacter glycogenicus TaxID=3140699 RepID=UPI002A17D309|nr:hypothetical protein [Dehalococcoidia bacterium]